MASCSSKPVDVPITIPSTTTTPPPALIQVTPIKIPCIDVAPWAKVAQVHIADVLGSLYLSDKLVHRYMTEWQHMRDQGQACIDAQKPH
jgi:hypothetical protein